MNASHYCNFLTASSGNKYPPSWTSVAVKEIFERVSNKPSNTTNSTTTNSTANPSLSSSSNSTSPSGPSGVTHGVIAGIVVGCTAAIALVAVVPTCMKKRRSRITKSINSPNELPSDSPFEPPLGELPTQWHTQELPSSFGDRGELPGRRTGMHPIELSTNELTIPEMSTGNRRSCV